VDFNGEWTVDGSGL